MISMAFDGIAVRALARELNTILAGGRVEKIYQPEKDELIFSVRTGSGKVRFYASSNNSHAGIFITADEYDNPVNPPGFCMLLRKHLQGGRIVSVTQKDIERIIEVEFDTRDELGYSVSRKLIVEIMGKYSNIVLVDMKDSKIIDSIKRISFDMDRVRQILPGQIYEYPPEQKKIPYTEVSLRDIEACCLASETGGLPLADILLADIMGISPLIARTLAGADDSCADDVYGRLRAMDAAVMSGRLDCAVYADDDGTPKDFHVVGIPEYEKEYTRIPFETVSSAAEYYYRNRSASSRVKQKASAMKLLLSFLCLVTYTRPTAISIAGSAIRSILWSCRMLNAAPLFLT